MNKETKNRLMVSRGGSALRSQCGEAAPVLVSPLAVLAVPVTMAKWRTRRAVSGVDAER
ncbi:hypothetical protein ACF3DV_21980 [Chlorogloeopsis fritschii PCC 9212]|uniref:hypothetical protein n=1 Tax=Chlorogloeopsis fritschii TaxID=1124 RepID=UPI00370DDB05